MKKKKTQKPRAISFSEILTIVVIIVLLTGVVMIVVNPFELKQKSRDTIRKTDMDNLQAAIERVIVDRFTGTASAVFLEDLGSSLEKDAARGDGLGWVKVDIRDYLSSIPLDPVNDDVFHYEFGHKNGRYELRARFESGERISTIARNDGGDDDAWYEVGTDLTIL